MTTSSVLPTRRRNVVRSMLLTAMTLLTIGCVPTPADTESAEADERESSESIAAGEITSDATQAPDPEPEETSTSADTEKAKPDAYIASFDFESGSNLYRVVDGDIEPVTRLALSNEPVQLTDLAMSSEGVLYGSTFDRIVRIDVDSGDVVAVTPPTLNQVNALTFLRDGRLLGADLDGVVSVIDIETGETETIATYPPDLISSGDIAVATDGVIYATATDRAVDYLLTIDADTGEVAIRSTDLPLAVYGLIPADDGGLIGMTFVPISESCRLGQLIAIDVVREGDDGGSANTADVNYRTLSCLDFTPGGATEG